MSDPVTNAEVEDVLSSIRRLVSEDKRPQAAASMLRPDDRLVLTPALRVAASDGEETPQDEDIQDAVEEAIADFQDEDSLVDEAVQPEQSHQDPIEAAENDDMDFAQNDVTEDHLDDVWDDVEDAVEPGGVAAEGTATADSLSAKIAALETAIGSIHQEWEPDDAGTDEYSGTDAPAMDWEDDDTPETTDRLILKSAEDHPQIEEAKFEPAVSGDTGAETSAETVFVTPEVTEEPVAAVQADDEAPFFDEADGLFEATADLGDDGQLIDEEALRDLVGEIVRSELQGALGERITRNVRKLVRREIHRALAAQDLE